VRDYVFVADVVRANLAAIDGLVTRPIMNVCTGEATSTRLLADHLQQQLGQATEVRDGPRRAGDLERSVLDPTLCISVLGELTSREAGLAQTARWFAEH
jgi:UDP-glucose 4-epimerase